MLYIIFLQQIHVVHVTVRFILLQLQLQAFRTPDNCSQIKPKKLLTMADQSILISAVLPASPMPLFWPKGSHHIRKTVEKADNVRFGRTPPLNG